MEPSSPNHLICKLPILEYKQKKNELDNKIFHNGEQRRVVGEVDKLLSGLLRNMFRTVDLDIRGGKEARLEQNGPNDKKNHDHGSGGACNKTS